MKPGGVRASCKVCVVAPLPPPYGGMSLQAEKLISRLTQEGIPMAVVSTNPSPPKGLQWVASIPGVRTLLRELQYVWRLLRTINGCTAIHHFSASGLYFFLQSIPVLVFGCGLHKRTILNYRGGNAANFLKRWHWFVVPFMRLAGSIAVPSEFLQQVFREYGLEATVLPNIADTELFPWRERGHFAPVLLVTRHLEPMYNVECLLRALRTIQIRFPEAVLGVAGDGSEERRLRALVNEWRLPGVKFYGAVAYRDLPALYASHDIYVNSSNIDNFPGALVEAACSGLPIVTTRAGGIRWMVRDRQTGILVDLDDDAALAAGVIEILENPELGSHLSQQARSWAEQFSWKHIRPTLLASYGRHEVLRDAALPEREILT